MDPSSLCRRLLPLLAWASIGCPPPDETSPRDSADEDTATDRSPGDWADRYKAVVLLFQGAGAPEDPVDTITSQGFELVVGATEEDVALVASIVVDLPEDLGTRSLLPSAELTGAEGPSGFWGYYGTAEGLIPSGTIEFHVTLHDDTEFTLTREHPGTVVDIPRAITLQRNGSDLTVDWQDVAGVKNYSIAIYTSNEDGTTLTDTGEGCEAGDPAGTADDPPPPSTCVAHAPEGTLTPGAWYIVSVGAWGYEQPEGIASYSGNHSSPFTW